LRMPINTNCTTRFRTMPNPATAMQP